MEATSRSSAAAVTSAAQHGQESAVQDEDASCQEVIREMADEMFECPVCRDLVFKPIVNVCGHVFCFWCVHRSMSSFTGSRCPMCRTCFDHFPRVCSMLHFLLQAAVQPQYQEREAEVAEEERALGVQSPSIPAPPHSLLPTRQQPVACEVTGEERPGSAEARRGGGEAETQEAETVATAAVAPSPSSPPTPSTALPTTTTATGGFFRTLLTCPVCSDLLFRPLVLNCGHVMCCSCVLRAPPPSAPVLCPLPSCQAAQPMGPQPEVCISLHDVMLRCFSRAMERRAAERKALAGKRREGEEEREDGSERRDGDDGRGGMEGWSGRESVEDDKGGKVPDEHCGGRGPEDRGQRNEASSSGRAGGGGGERVGEHGHAVAGKERLTKDGSEGKWMGEGVADMAHEMTAVQLAMGKMRDFYQRLKAAQESGTHEEKREAAQALEEAHKENYLHFGAGCDCCGAIPIVGRRFRCLDCPEAIGFDLCAPCHALAGSAENVEGRFNQRHTKEHRMVEVVQEESLFHSFLLANADMSAGQLMQLLLSAEEDGEGIQDSMHMEAGLEEDEENDVVDHSDGEERDSEIDGNRIE